MENFITLLMKYFIIFITSFIILPSIVFRRLRYLMEKAFYQADKWWAKHFNTKHF